MYIWQYQQESWLTPPSPDENSQSTWHYLWQLKVLDCATPYHLLWGSIHCTRHVAWSLQKTWVCQTLLSTTLMYYDWFKPVIVDTDASKYGLGAALIQNNYPIAFTSKTLTDIETCYANIERECLSVCFSLEKFHICLCGKHVIL